MQLLNVLTRSTYTVIVLVLVAITGICITIWSAYDIPLILAVAYFLFFLLGWLVGLCCQTKKQEDISIHVFDQRHHEQTKSSGNTKIITHNPDAIITHNPDALDSGNYDDV